MRLLLNAGFGRPIGRADLELIDWLGFDGVRQDIPGPDALDLVDEIATFRTTMFPIFLVGGGKMGVTEQDICATAGDVAIRARRLGLRCAIEIGNEPDIAPAWSPERFAGLVLRATEEIQALNPNVIPITGGISSTSPEAIKYLRSVMTLLDGGGVFPVEIGYHTYRWSPSQPRAGWDARADEFAALHAIAGCRGIWNTESGWHTARERRGLFGLCSRRLSDNEVSDFIDAEIRENYIWGAESYTLYQLNDGPRDTWEDRFGIRRLDGTLKPSAFAAGVWKERRK